LQEFRVVFENFCCHVIFSVIDLPKKTATDT
jgi:hypothetical protein